MAQYDQLLLFYNQLINMADEISELIEKELFDDIMVKMQLHDKVMIQIKLAKKCTQLSVAEEVEINRLTEILKEKEQNNIQNLQQNMTKVKMELDRVKMQNKLQKAYSQDTTSDTSGTIIDIEDSYRPK